MTPYIFNHFCQEKIKVLNPFIKIYKQGKNGFYTLNNVRGNIDKYIISYQGKAYKSNHIFLKTQFFYNEKAFMKTTDYFIFIVPKNHYNSYIEQDYKFIIIKMKKIIQMIHRKNYIKNIRFFMNSGFVFSVQELENNAIIVL